MLIIISVISGDTFQDGVEKDPDYSGGIEKAFEDYDKFYDGYEEDYPNVANHSEGRCVQYTTWVFLLLACLVFVGLFS